MQHTSGIFKILNLSWVYDLLQSLVAPPKGHRWLAREWWRIEPGHKVIDAGCGTGLTLRFMPEGIDYLGFDLSEPYILTAQKEFGDRGTFVVATAGDLLQNDDPRFRDADVLICNGILHHLPEEAIEDLFRLAKRALKPGGRMVCLEPTFLEHQSRTSRWLLNQDRGKGIRTQLEWQKLFTSHFPNSSVAVITSLYRIPYVHIVSSSTNEPQGSN